jgi:hypothetical protein
MFRHIINNISDDALLWTLVSGIMLFPVATPIWLCTAMLISCCKSHTFMDNEYERLELVNKLINDEFDINDLSCDSEDSSGYSDDSSDDEKIIDTEQKNSESVDVIKQMSTIETEEDKKNN